MKKNSKSKQELRMELLKISNKIIKIVAELEKIDGDK